MSKPNIGEVGKLIPNINSIWTPQGKKGDGECSDELFQFTASG